MEQRIDLSGISFVGRVLDIGGGGDGTISRHTGGSVVAIDNRYDELAETPDAGLKIVMDACDLKFLDGYFDDVTCFFSLMYMDLEQIEKCFREAYRVSKKGAGLYIWDAVIPPPNGEDVFIINLKVKVSEKDSFTTGYGVSHYREQSADMIQDLCEKAGFRLEERVENTETFFLRFGKE